MLAQAMTFGEKSMFGYVYLTRIRTSRRVLLYVGKKHSSEFDKNYNGSGRVVSFIRKNSGKGKLNTRAIAWANSEEELNAMEKYYIAKARVKYGKHCVNSADGGDGLSPSMARKILNTPSVRARHLAGIRAAQADPELKMRRSVSMKNFKSSSEERKIQSERTKMAWSKPESRARRMAAMKASNDTQKTKERRSACMKAKMADPRFSEHIRSCSKKAWSDQEYRSRISKARKEMWSDPDFRLRRAAALKLAIETPEHRAKLSNSAKSGWVKRRSRNLAKSLNVGDCGGP